MLTVKMAENNKPLVLETSGAVQYIDIQEKCNHSSFRIWKFILIVMLIILSVAVTALFFLTLRESAAKKHVVIKSEPTRTTRPPSLPPKKVPHISAALKASPPPQNKQKEDNRIESIELCGDGYFVQHVKKGMPISHWKIYEKHGKCSLVSTKYITISSSGLYKVYAQAAFYGNNPKSNLDFTIVRNRQPVAKVALDHCKVLCSRYLLRIVSLKQGDYLSMQTGSNASFLMSSKMTFFGVSKLL